MDSEELLAQLADIHLPEAVSYWPPAPGWWILGLLVLAAAFTVLRWWLKRQHRQRLLASALAELDQAFHELADSGDPGLARYRLSYANSVNTIMRRVALQHEQNHPATAQVGTIGSLAGDDWLDFLRSTGDSSLLDDDLARLLSKGRFQAQAEVDADKLDAMARRWVSSLYRPQTKEAQRPPTTEAETSH